MHALYGPCDPKWGSWFEAPGWVFGAYVAMMPRIQAERMRQLLDVALASNGRSFEEKDRRTFLRDLADAAIGGRRMRRAPKASLSFLQRAGVRMKGGEDGRPAARSKRSRAENRSETV